MSHDQRPYPAYRDSGLPWLGEIPAHWQTMRAKYLYREVDERSVTGEEVLCSVSHTTGVTPRKANVTMFMAETTVGYKIVRPDDLAINTLWAWMAALGIARQIGVVSPAYGVYRPRPDSSLVPAFADRLLRIPQYKREYIARSTGVNASRLRLYPDQFLCIRILLPPVDEQVAIVAYLDALDRKINRFVKNRRRLIDVLNEQKQAVINRVMAHGLGGATHLQPSGLAWLGDLPAAWKRQRLKFLVQNVNEQTSARESGDTYIALEHVESWTGRVTPPADGTVFESQVKRFRPGDVLFGKLRPYLAKVTRPQVKGVCVGEFLVLRVADESLLPAFLEQKLRSSVFIDVINSSTFGAKMPRADWTFIGNLLITYPATCEEQESILSAIEAQTAELQAAMDTARREIALVREYRDRLIADVVTGKVDVRGLEMAEGDVANAEVEDLDVDVDPETQEEAAELEAALEVADE